MDEHYSTIFQENFSQFNIDILPKTTTGPNFKKILYKSKDIDKVRLLRSTQLRKVGTLSST